MGSNLTARESLLHVLRGARRRAVGVVIEVLALSVCRIKVAIGAQALVHAAPEQLIDRLIDRLADDVPAGHLQPAHHAHQRQIRPQGKARAMTLAPHGLDMKRITSQEVAREHVLDHGRDDLGTEGRGIDLAHALDAARRPQLEKDEIAAAVARRRVSDHEYFHVLEFHKLFRPCELAGLIPPR